MDKETHVSYEEFSDQVNLIVLKDSQTIKSSFRKTLRESGKIINQILKREKTPKKLNSKLKRDIVDSMFKGYDLENEAKIISEEHSIPSDVVETIFRELKESKSLKKKGVDFEHEGKRPIGKWDYHPKDYKGFDDEKYGSAFQTTYIPTLGLFFVVIDLDSHDKDDIPMDALMDAIPKEYLNTRIINSPTNNGKHLFYLSREPLQRKDSGNVNIDYKTIRKHDVEKTSEGYKTTGKGGYVVSSFRWSYDGETREEYKWDENSNKDILVVDNVDDVLSQIYSNLHDEGLISDSDYNNLMEIDLGENVDSIVDNIAITSKDTSQINKDSDNERTDSISEKDSNKYDDNGVLLLNNDNGIQLIIEQVGNIFKKTEGKHRGTIMALEGWFERLGFSPEERFKILSEGLKMANDLSHEHLSQIKLSVSKNSSNRKKTGLPTLLKESPEIDGEIRIIKTIRMMFWRDISKMSYQLIEIPFLEMMEEISTLIGYDTKLNDLEDGKYDEFIEFAISDEVDLYLEMLGVGLFERCSLLKQCFLKLDKNPQQAFEKYVSKKLIEGDDDYGRYRFGNNLLPYKKTSFGKRILKTLTIKGEDNQSMAWEIVNKIDDLCISLDIQISQMVRVNKWERYVQPLINLIERPKGWQEYKRRQHAFKYLKDNDSLKKTKRHDYIFDSVENNSYIEINPRSLGDYLSKKYPILSIGIEEEELKKILSISGTFDELKNEYYIFNNGVLKLHEREFVETNDFRDYFTIKKMDCNVTFHYLPLDLNPLSHTPENLWDKTLREITIPNYEDDNPNLDIGYYLDCLERIGSAFNTRIKDKRFVCYYGDGDNGKGILIEMLKLIFGDRFLLVTMDVIQDDKLDLSEYDVLVIDELDELSFDDAIAYIKRITGGEEDGTAQREHYSHDAYIPKNPSAFFLFTNKIPQVDLSDNAFYRREDAIKLQNHFIVNPNPTKPNEFREDSDLKEKLKSEIAIGREWIVNASLQAYYNRHNKEGMFKGFTREQTPEETKMIVSNTNPMTKYLLESYTVDDKQESLIKNGTICENYRNYCLREGLTYHSKGINANMGRAIKEVFGDVKKEKSDGNYYYLKPKSEVEIMGEDDIVYQTDEDNNWEDNLDYIPHKEQSQYFGVYTRIKELSKLNTPPTKRLLKSEFHMYNVEMILSKLLDIELIYQTTREEIET